MYNALKLLDLFKFSYFVTREAKIKLPSIDLLALPKNQFFLCPSAPETPLTPAIQRPSITRPSSVRRERPRSSTASRPRRPRPSWRRWSREWTGTRTTEYRKRFARGWQSICVINHCGVILQNYVPFSFLFFTVQTMSFFGLGFV